MRLKMLWRLHEQPSPVLEDGFLNKPPADALHQYFGENKDVGCHIGRLEIAYNLFIISGTRSNGNEINLPVRIRIGH